MRPASILLALLVLACGAEPERLSVLARMGEPPLDRALPKTIRRVARGGEARPGFCLPPGSAFTLPVAPGARRVVFGVGLHGEQPAAFTVAAEDGSSPLFEVEVPAGSQGWTNGAIDLPPGTAPEALRFASSGGADAVCWAGVAMLGRDERSPPNVLLVSLDTLGAWALGPVDGKGPTISPAIDAFLAEGFHFERAYAPYPATLASHASIFSGTHPIRHGHYNDATGLDTLVSTFARYGYRTAAFTENAYVGSGFGFDRGFDRYDDGKGGGDAAVGLLGDAVQTFERARAWLRTHADTRFFLFVHTYEVHSPYLPRGRPAIQLANRITPGDGRIFQPTRSVLAISTHNEGGKPLDDRTLQRLRALHLGEVLQLDALFAGFLSTLDELGLERDTLVVVTADHGEVFGLHRVAGHGLTLHEHLLKVPLGFRWPGHVKTGSSRAPVELVDVLPTVLDLVGIDPPEAVDGRSLATLLRGEGALPEREATFAEVLRHGKCPAWDLPCTGHLFGVRTERHRYLRLVLPDGDAVERLYDVEADPREEQDLAAQEPERLARHRALLDEHLDGAAPRMPARAREADVDDATRQRLRALGYTD